MSDNYELVAMAAAGNMQPLIDKLLTGIAPSGSPATSENDRGDPPSDTLWYTVINAHADGELSDEQYAQATKAMYEGHGQTPP